MTELNQYIDTIPTYVNSIEYHATVSALTDFFVNRGYTKVCTQNRFSICTACEDPQSVACHEYGGKVWPLVQTGQMWLEYEIMTYPELQKGVFCETTSYREEKNPIPGRHFLSFPLFEFESLGDFDTLISTITDLLKFLGYSDPVHLEYSNIANEYNTREIENVHENRMHKEISSACLLKNFPLYTNPFWNMKVDEEAQVAKKIDVILSGMETIGSAERSCDNEMMRKMFYSICDGEYCQTIFNKFGKERTEAELEAFIKLNKIPRFGGGIGVTRLISSLKNEGLMSNLIAKYVK
jgi:aspartyl/asparaginyl-tRNA synthetase